MKIVSFSVKNFRSITNAHKIPIFDKNVLIGPNNEGKSNILQGLILTLQYLISSNSTRRFPHYYNDDEFSYISYDWKRDFPIPLQNRNSEDSSDFTIEFELSPDEKKQFNKKIGSNLSNNLILNISFYRDKVNFKTTIPGKATKEKTKIYRIIAEFFKNHFNFQYIPAVRTARYAIDIVENLLSIELSQLEEDKKYLELIKQLESLQKPVLKNLASRLTTSISEFIPDVKKIELSTRRILRRAIRRSCSISIDDGVLTDLIQKGDGIKSLVAISLLRHSSKKVSRNRNLILAIEEPESHLHPAAIHRLGSVLSEISTEQQVIITTHSPLLVDRLNINNNIIVNKSKARAAKNISQIRNILGVQVSDNLTSASCILLVEGKEDFIILKSWLQTFSNEIKNAIETNALAFDDLQGGSNLSYKASLYQNLLCNVFVFLDHDKCGRDSFKYAKSKALLNYKDVVFSRCPGMKNSEIEDFITIKTYKKVILEKFGVDLKGNIFRNSVKGSLF